jgi:UDP-2-acetamido-3-amino-2,3-dideoxy-glucuronate N-acetyltransferase
MGKDVFVEKPITMISSEAFDLIKLAEQRQCLLQVGHIFRYDPASKWFRHAVQEGKFGRVHLMRSAFCGFKRPRMDHGVMFADAIHFVDLFNYVLGTTPAKVTAVLNDFLGRGMDDAAFLSLHYDLPQGPVSASIEANYFFPKKSRELTVVGSELTAVCDFNLSQYKITTYGNRHVQVKGAFQAEEGVAQQIESPPEEPLMAELRSFLQSMETRQTPLADGWSGYHSVRVLEAALRSAASGQTVSLPA